MARSPIRVAWTAPVAAVLCLCPAVSGQARPHLFAMGRYCSTWAGRPRSYDQDIWDHMVNIGATMNGAGLAWCDAEPAQGTYDWNAIDYADFAVDEILDRGMEPTFFLGLTPEWACLVHVTDPETGEYLPHRTPPSEDYVDEFMDFHRFVADRYKDQVQYYYFWNEPNGCSWINDGCANGDSYPLYTQWLIRCSQAVKQMDPDAKIIAGNLDYHSGVTHGYEYVQGMYDHGAGPHIDGVAIHPYDWAGTIHWQAVTDTRSVMVANGDADKPIWITEYGWNSGSQEDLANRLTYVLTELKKSEWNFVQMASYLVLNDGSGVENYGLTDAELNPRLRYYAFGDVDKTWPPLVDFSADVAAGPAPLAVQFTDESAIVGAHTWYWEFGDDQTSGDQHPWHEYTQQGTYTVRLTVTGTGGPEMAEKEGFIRVGVFPQVAFIGGQLPPTESDSKVIGHLESLGLLVDPYDDEPENRPTAADIAATHDLVVASSTTLSVNVGGDFRNESVPFIFWESALAWCDPPDNNRECMANGPVAVNGHTQIDVLDNSHPVMQGIPTGAVTLTTSGEYFSYCTSTVAPGAQVLATAVGNPDYKTVIVAEPGAQLLDGGVAAGKRVFLYLYDTTWLQTNTNGKKILDNSLAYTLGSVAADFTASLTAGLTPLTVEFTDQSAGPVTSWTWDFGDDETSTMRNPSHTYTQAGTYDVSLTVTGPGGPDSRVRYGYVTAQAGTPADFDRDDDVDQEDFGHLQACFTGAEAGPPASGCEDADLNGDGDIDQDDFELFQQCLSGPNAPADPACANQ